MKYPNYMMLIMALSAVMAMVYDSDAFYSIWALSIFVFSGASALSVRNTKKVFLWIPIVVLSVVGLVITFLYIVGTVLINKCSSFFMIF